jgi:hypothetical protein
VVNGRIKILNRGTNPLAVYPPPNAQIESLGANVAGTVAVNASADFVCAGGPQWYVA